jgi:hypothetical protein
MSVEELAVRMAGVLGRGRMEEEVEVKVEEEVEEVVSQVLRGCLEDTCVETELKFSLYLKV